MTLSEAQLAQRRAAGQARGKQFTPEHQAAAALAQSREEKQQAGRVGQAVLVEKYGPGYVPELGARHRRKHLSRPARRVYRWLRAWGYPFDTEAPMGRYFADFWLHQHNIVIEVDGDYWHEGCEAYDLEKTRFIVLARNCIVIRLPEHAVMDKSARKYLFDRLSVFAPLPTKETL